MIYLDNAATSFHKPPAVINAVNYALKNYSANPGRSGHNASLAASVAVFNTREKLSRMFGCEGAENVVFTANNTYALNCIIKGVLHRGDHVITSDLEHNAVMRPLDKLQREGFITYSTAVTDTDDDITLQNFKKLIKPETRLVVCTHASNVLGAVLPVEKIGRMCKEQGILFAVDAAQSAGVLDIDMQKMNIDFLCVAPHKGLYAPMGTGVLIARKPIKNTIVEGGTGTASLSLVQPEIMPEQFESGTLNVPGICGISAGVDFVAKKTPLRIYKHEFSLLDRLYNILSQNKKIIFYWGKPVLGKTAPVLSFNVAGMRSEQTAEFLNSKNIAVRAGYHCAPSAHKKVDSLDSGTVRVSFGAFNTKNDVDYLVNSLKFL